MLKRRIFGFLVTCKKITREVQHQRDEVIIGVGFPPSLALYSLCHRNGSTRIYANHTSPDRRLLQEQHFHYTQIRYVSQRTLYCTVTKRPNVIGKMQTSVFSSDLRAACSANFLGITEEGLSSPR